MMEQHMNSNKHKKLAKAKGRRGSFSTEDGATSIEKDSEAQSSQHNPFDDEFVNKTLTENSKIEEPRKNAMDSLRICLFCDKPSEGVKKNLDHMRIAHSFYILDIDCLISLKALLHYLAEKIHVGHCCINCNKTFQDGFSVQNHMKDMCHCCMNSDAFEDEYEYFYDFAPTYQTDFVGKKIEDFDLTEEPLAKPLTEKIFSKVDDEELKQDDMEMQGEPMEDIVENADENDEEWEDVDVEDAEEAKEASATMSYQKVSAPSTSSFTMIDKPGSETNSQINESSQSHGKIEESKSFVGESNLSENEVAKLLERRKKNRFDYQKVTDTYKKATVLETGEVELPNGKVIGHRQWAREYKQRLNLRDAKEQMIIEKLGIEYKKMGAGNAIQKSFNFHNMFKKAQIDKQIHKDKRYELKLGVKGNKVNTTHFRLQIN